MAFENPWPYIHKKREAESLAAEVNRLRLENQQLRQKVTELETELRKLRGETKEKV
jgi:ubiquinone biosynthesis protein UbiJ